MYLNLLPKVTPHFGCTCTRFCGLLRALVDLSALLRFVPRFRTRCRVCGLACDVEFVSHAFRRNLTDAQLANIGQYILHSRFAVNLVIDHGCE